MVIDCMVDEVKFKSEWIQKIKTYKLGTQDFFNSVSTISIDYDEDQEKKFFEDLNITHSYFNNLKYVNLSNIKYVSLSYIVQILNNYNMNHIQFFDSNKSRRYNSKNKIKSEEGCLVLYDSENTLFIHFKNFVLY